MVQERIERFDPPEEGMLPGESIVWSRKAGSVFWIMFCGIGLPMVGVMILAFIFPTFGDFVSLLVLGSIVAGFLYILASYINLRRTRYYLTTERIIEVRSDNIRKEIPLERFTGRPISQFIESKVMHLENGQPIYRIRIYDPTSDDMIALKGLDENSARAFEIIGETVECPYCRFDNTALSRQCKNCDAVL